MLRGRRDECAVLDGLLEGARVGRSGVLVLKGEAGVGKTALLEYAVGAASEMRRIRAAGVESEMELAFAALHQLCVPLLEWLERLPGPQRDALATTFGLSAGAVPDRFFVGLATLGLLSEAADERPLLCVIDDAHRLDRASAQALAFVARRLQAESVPWAFDGDRLARTLDPPPAATLAIRRPHSTAHTANSPQSARPQHNYRVDNSFFSHANPGDRYGLPCGTFGAAELYQQTRMYSGGVCLGVHIRDRPGCRAG
jgi:predicted ATPase